MSRKHQEHKKNSFLSSVSYYIVIVALIAGLGLVYVENHSRQKEREVLRQSLMKDETEEKIGSIEITEPSSQTDKEQDSEEKSASDASEKETKDKEQN